jgi:MFS family permease
LYFTSLFAIGGGLLMIFFVGDGPYRKKGGKFQINAIPTIFQSVKWRQAAFGYFGHMWELYTFWGFVPVMLALYNETNHSTLNIPLLSFLIIGCGSISCIAGGYLSGKIGSAKVATTSLLISGICCLFSPLLFSQSAITFVSFIFIWGLAVIPDSPQFSTLVAQYAPPELRGTALTIYNSIGFSIAVLSLIAIDYLFHGNSFLANHKTFSVLGIGAVFGLPFMFKLMNVSRES